MLAQAQTVSLELIGRFDSGLGEGAAEIVAYHAGARRLFVTNAAEASVDIVDIADPTRPTLVRRVDLGALGEPTSVATSGDLAAAAVAAEGVANAGLVVFLDPDGTVLGQVTVGVLPDMVAFTPDGGRLLVANEGEPSDDYAIDPEGSISIIDLGAGLATATATELRFGAFDAAGPRAGELPADVRVFGPGATVAQDLEPEFIAVAPDGATAWVSLQENNALAILDVPGRTIERIVGLGSKDHAQAANALDPSDRDGGIRIGAWPVHGLYQPDALAAFAVDGETFVISANEGDARAYTGFSEETRIADLELDADAFPDAAALRDDAALGRLKTTAVLGDDDGDGAFERLFSYGARSFSIWRGHDGTLVYDSGDAFERIAAATVPGRFNSQGRADGFDSRSDDKGPEPEAVAVGTIAGRALAFIGLERLGGVMVYDVSDPAAPMFLTYRPSDPPDLAPEGLAFVAAEDSPIGLPLLIAAHEVSGTTTIYEVVTGAGADGLGTCVADAMTLCLGGGRYAVTANGRTPDGRAGRGEATPLTDVAGAFGFFQPGQLELFVKVLDACDPGAPRLWLFLAGAADLETGLTVTDTVSGRTEAYWRARGGGFVPAIRAQALDGCP